MLSHHCLLQLYNHLIGCDDVSYNHDNINFPLVELCHHSTCMSTIVTLGSNYRYRTKFDVSVLNFTGFKAENYYMIKEYHVNVLWYEVYQLDQKTQNGLAEHCPMPIHHLVAPDKLHIKRHKRGILLAHLSRRLTRWAYRMGFESACVCLSVCPSVHTFKHEYLLDKRVKCYQILSEASLGWGKSCVRFWARSNWNSGFHGNG